MTFAAIVAALDFVVLVYWATLGGSLSQMLAALAALLLIDAAIAAVLRPARTSIARSWVEASDVLGMAAFGGDDPAR